MSLACRHLLYGMLDSNPVMRISVEDALQHPWVTIDSPQGDSLQSPEVRCCSPLLSALPCFPCTCPCPCLATLVQPMALVCSAGHRVVVSRPLLLMSSKH